MYRRGISHLFGKKIRYVWIKSRQTWFYSVIDFVAALCVSKNPGRYWSDQKRRQKIISDELYAICVKFRLDSKDGKKRPTDLVTVEVLVKIIEVLPRSKSPKIGGWFVNRKQFKHTENFDFVVHKKVE